MEALSKRYKIKTFIAPKMKDLIKFLDNNGKYAVYTRRNINGIYCYLDMIGDPKTLTTSDQCFHHFGHSSSINNDTASIQPFISCKWMIHNSICKCCGRIGQRAYACIIRGPKLLPPSLTINMNQLNNLHGEEPNEPTRVWNRQPLAYHFTSRTSPHKTSPVVSDTTGRINYHGIDDDEMDHLLEFLHS